MQKKPTYGLAPEFYPPVSLTGHAGKNRETVFEEIMTIAVFKPLRVVEKEWEGFRNHAEVVWEKLVQKVIHADEVDNHVADGWHTDAKTALEAADLEETKAQNASLQKQIDTAQAQQKENAESVRKLDGRSKEGRAIKQFSTDGTPLYYNPETKVIFGSTDEQPSFVQSITVDDVPGLVEDGATVDHSADGK